MNAMTAIDVTKLYGEGHTQVKALSDASLELHENEFLALLGPSGSGKTTLLSVIGGLLAPTKGTVTIGDTHLSELSKKAQTRFRANRVGFVFQGFNLVPFLTAREDHADWMMDVESIIFLDNQASGVGTTMDVLTRVGPFTTTDVIVVEEWNKPNSFVVLHRGVVSGHGAFLLEADDGVTCFTWRESLRFPWYLGGRVTAALAGPLLVRIWRANLRRFAAAFD